MLVSSCIGCVYQGVPPSELGKTAYKHFEKCLDHALVTSGAPLRDDSLKNDDVIVFATHCLNRNVQLVTAMAVNVCLWWPLRRHWRLVITTFGADTELVMQLREMLSLAIDIGVVVLTSGGDFGVHCSSTRQETAKPAWMPRLPQEALPGGEVSALSMPKMRYWHACVAKNTSHMASIFCFGTDVCLVNLDCDQVVPLEYVHGLLKLWHDTGRSFKGFCVKCKNCHSSLTGRFACRASDWLELGGYDEVDTPPSGGQDVDMRSRIELLANQSNPLFAKKRWTLDGEDICGGSLPNDFVDVRSERTTAKIANCDPAVLQTYAQKAPHKVWATMNNDGWNATFGPRLKQQILVRNEVIYQEKCNLGAWNVVVNWRQLPEHQADEYSRLTSRSRAPTSTALWLAEGDEGSLPQSSNAGHAIDGGSFHGYGVEVIIVPGNDLAYRNRTENTCLGEPHMLAPLPC